MGSEDGHVCAECNQQIKGAAMKAKERFYCETTCFKCVTCNVNLREIPVYCKEDSLYCEEHYKSKFIPKCAKCADYITEGCIRALGSTWHSSHFCCHGCELNFSDAQAGYHENEGKAFCQKCYTNNILPKCKGCGQPITDRTMKAMDGVWHVTCFVCKDCRCTFEGQKSFYAIDDLPVCGPCAGIGEEPQD